jgi:hypothetical protein
MSRLWDDCTTLSRYPHTWMDAAPKPGMGRARRMAGGGGGGTGASGSCNNSDRQVNFISDMHKTARYVVQQLAAHAP